MRKIINLNSAELDIDINHIKYQTTNPGVFSWYGMTWPPSAATLLFTGGGATDLGVVHEISHCLGGAGDNDGYRNWKGTETCRLQYDYVPVITDTGLEFLNNGSEFCAMHILFLRGHNFIHGIRSTPPVGP